MNKGKKYETKFGELYLESGTENDFFWSGNIDISNDSHSSDKAPIYIFTKNWIISNETIEFVEKMVLDINLYLEASILYLKKTLTEQREKYNINENEYLLISDSNYCPVEKPEFIFYEDSIEWMIRFAEGIFSICDPLGIAVTFKFSEPISLDNLEDCECI